MSRVVVGTSTPESLFCWSALTPVRMGTSRAPRRARVVKASATVTPRNRDWSTVNERVVNSPLVATNRPPCSCTSE
jgi:hypothetical protein